MLPTGSSNFAPKPLMTFMVYKPEMQCEICWATGLELPEDPGLGGESDPEVDNATPELLPCGHVFCHECITRWYEGKNYFCPSCKAELVYGCDRGHSIPPIPLAKSTIGGIPKTLPEGGEIPARCTDCEESVIKDRQAVILRELKGRIAELQHGFREGDEDAERQLADFYRHQEVLREDQQELSFRKFTYSSW
ncbi:hypothetical protein B0T24DRAFT_532423 [Lasiosphaeria ovina]|uniref:RING-type domain-containing protein n=1 Tax=Lasiosphaeria ovina TaxID=92902 RepID=A0AAE0K3S7_9PEZI|nr:hypothetical protein B0T24DRAFT_532423 [Lasiosphaeria ovina]